MTRVPASDTIEVTLRYMAVNVFCGLRSFGIRQAHKYRAMLKVLSHVLTFPLLHLTLIFLQTLNRDAADKPALMSDCVG